jgi:hypothetical protein
MSEGGLNPWKLQRNPRPGFYVDYSRLAAPLPSPPSGYHWVRDGETNAPALMDEHTGAALSHVPAKASEEASLAGDKVTREASSLLPPVMAEEAVVVDAVVEMPEYLEHVVRKRNRRARALTRQQVEAATHGVRVFEAHVSRTNHKL